MRQKPDIEGNKQRNTLLSSSADKPGSRAEFRTAECQGPSNILSGNYDLRGISDDAVGQELERSDWRANKERSIIAVVLHNQGALEFFFFF